MQACEQANRSLRSCWAARSRLGATSTQRTTHILCDPTSLIRRLDAMTPESSDPTERESACSAASALCATRLITMLSSSDVYICPPASQLSSKPNICVRS